MLSRFAHLHYLCNPMKQTKSEQKKSTRHAGERHLTLGRGLRALFGSVWRHKYIWVIALFLIHVGFVDNNSFWRRYQLVAENEATMREIKRYEEKFEADRSQLRHLKTDPEALIRIARENHRMKAEGEDIYYIIENSDSI
ncbi:hypothetical protein IMSAGC014_00435 [Bacteroidaceae bacterium]|nr:hypothetical protein IMSAGC014_00435 [Bacteroidaceae bacterium]